MRPLNIIVKHIGAHRAAIDEQEIITIMDSMIPARNDTYTGEQWRTRTWRDRLRGSVKLPGDNADVVEVERLSLDIPVRDYEFLESFAVFRNYFAEAEGKKVLKKLSRKSLAEALMGEQVKTLRDSMAPLFAELGGELPKIDWTSEATKKASREAMRKYAERAVAWEKKQSKNGK